MNEESDYLDDDGYPTELALQKIKDWDLLSVSETRSQLFHELMDFVKNLWYYPEYFTRKGNTYYVHTGGWSGNEDLIGALHEHKLFWCFYFYLQERGGHYIFCPMEENVDTDGIWKMELNSYKMEENYGTNDRN